MSAHNHTSTNDSSFSLEFTPPEVEKSFGADVRARTQTGHSLTFLSETLEAPRTVILSHQCPLLRSNTLIFNPLRIRPTLATRNLRITTLHSTQTLTKTLFMMVCLQPNLSAPPVDRATRAESPYPEVRSAVANFDDTEMPGEPVELPSPHHRYSSNGEVNTLRAWVIGLFWAVLLPGVNQFFFFRYPTVTVGGVCLMTCRVGFTDKLGAISSSPNWSHIRWAGFGLGSCRESRFSVSR